MSEEQPEEQTGSEAEDPSVGHLSEEPAESGSLNDSAEGMAEPQIGIESEDALAGEARLSEWAHRYVGEQSRRRYVPLAKAVGLP